MKLDELIEIFNEGIKQFAPDGSQIFGNSQLTLKDKVTMPVVLKGQDFQYIGINDDLPCMFYHRANTINISDKATNLTSYGNDRAIITETYNNTLYVFLNRKKVKTTPDVIVSLIQKYTSGDLRKGIFKTLIIRLQNIILNSQTVFSGEYKSLDFKLRPEQNLFAINYQIEATYSNKCLEKCI